ncbi:RNA-directed DNA polymerase, eukaryota, reverse transcriptase zinc-binding domain protein, partial [Tanacetum coccineum]
MELPDVSYGIEYVARPLLLFFSSENQLLWFRYREYQYGVSNGLDMAYWGFLRARIRRIFLDGYGVLVFRIVIFKITSFNLQNARLLLFDDLCCSGLHFTWTKNIHKMREGDISGILKKLDRVMVNEDFINKYSLDHAIFIPYLISDHSFVVLIMPNCLKRKKKSFKFANYLTDKANFLKIVEEKWNVDIDGFSIYLDVVSDEEKLLYQKSKIKWLSYGDKNNAFFHKVLKGNYQRNIIHSVYDKGGQRFEGDHVATQFVNHFNQFLGNSPVVLLISDSAAIFSKKLSKRDANFMVRDVKDKEIKDAMFCIRDNKAPGPDGVSAKFFKKAWHIVGEDVCKAVKVFFAKGWLLGELNATIIALVPKMASPLKNFGFHEKMIKWIMQYVSSTKFSININGESYGYFKGGRGLRQGDPVSPYLFTLVMEYFTLIMEKNCFVMVILICKRLLGIPIEGIGTARLRSCSSGSFTTLSVWVVQKEVSDSWGWKNFLDIRDLVLQHVKYKIGDGKQTFMWYDNWSGLGPLINCITHRSLYDAKLGKACIVADICCNSSWSWPDDWTSMYPFIRNVTVPLIIPNKKDKISWIDNNRVKHKFNMSNVYHNLKDDTSIVVWSSLVWYTQCIPKHSLILWMAYQGKLLTQDRIKKWGSFDMMACSLCKSDEGLHNNLFFQCNFFKRIWEKIQELMDCHILKVEWLSIVETLAMKPCQNKIWSIVRRLCIGATVYAIWCERNFRIFRNEERDWNVVLQIICDNVKLRLI